MPNNLAYELYETVQQKSEQPLLSVSLPIVESTQRIGGQAVMQRMDDGRQSHAREAECHTLHDMVISPERLADKFCIAAPPNESWPALLQELQLANTIVWRKQQQQELRLYALATKLAFVSRAHNSMSLVRQLAVQDMRASEAAAAAGASREIAMGMEHDVYKQRIRDGQIERSL